MPTLTEMAFILTQIGHMVTHWSPPRHSIECHGDDTREIPKLYARGREAMSYCLNDLRPNEYQQRRLHAGQGRALNKWSTTYVQ